MLRSKVGDRGSSNIIDHCANDASLLFFRSTNGSCVVQCFDSRIAISPSSFFRSLMFDGSFGVIKVDRRSVIATRIRTAALLQLSGRISDTKTVVLS